jgi:hypothetical protein
MSTTLLREWAVINRKEHSDFHSKEHRAKQRLFKTKPDTSKSSMEIGRFAPKAVEKYNLTSGGAD